MAETVKTPLRMGLEYRISCLSPRVRGNQGKWYGAARNVWLMNVRFRGESGHWLDLSLFPLVTQSGHAVLQRQCVQLRPFGNFLVAGCI